MADVDFFKLYNDSHGHQAGDNCLKGIATLIEHCCERPTDVVGRFGGEEFVLILPDTNIEVREGLQKTYERQLWTRILITGHKIPIQSR
jgi:diguanylate cyclase (GGDEF)-like protein